jgi:hypothetical protein
MQWSVGPNIYWRMALNADCSEYLECCRLAGRRWYRGNRDSLLERMNGVVPLLSSVWWPPIFQTEEIG